MTKNATSRYFEIRHELRRRKVESIRIAFAVCRKDGTDYTFPFFCICMNRSPMRQERMAQEISTGTPPLQLFKHPPIQIRKRERKHSPPRFHTSQADLHTAYRCSCLSQKERGRIPSTFCKSWRIRKPPRRRAPPRYGATDCTWPYGRNATSNRS